MNTAAAHPQEPCAGCGAPVAAEFTFCPECGAGTQVEIRLDGPVQDGRTRLALARAVSALPGGSSYQALQKQLGQTRPLLAANVTRARAREFVRIAASNGVAARLSPAAQARNGARKTRSVSTRAAVTAAVVIAAIGAGVPIGLRLLRTPAGEAIARTVATGTPAAAPAAEPVTTLSGRELAARTLRSAVEIRTDTAVGAGVFVLPERVLTNQHVAGTLGSSVVVRTHDGTLHKGKTIAIDAYRDLALVEVPGATERPLRISGASTLQVGDRVLAVGSPKGLGFTVSQGTVSYLGRRMLGLSYVQADMNVNPGNSGGPLVDAAGRLVGIVSMKMANANGLGLVLPVEYAFFGKDALIKDHDAAEPPQWAAVRDRAADEDAEEVRKLREALDRPGILNAAAVEGVAVLVLGLMATEEPPREALTFSLERGGTAVCRELTASPREWLTADAAAANLGPQLTGWMRRHELTSDLQIGVVALDWRWCPTAGDMKDSEVVLRGARPGAQRASLMSAPGR